MQGYAYIISHPGMPCILWEHAFDWGLYDALKALIEARRKAGVTMASPVAILCAEADMCGARLRGLAWACMCGARLRGRRGGVTLCLAAGRTSSANVCDARAGTWRKWART